MKNDPEKSFREQLLIWLITLIFVLFVLLAYMFSITSCATKYTISQPDTLSKQPKAEKVVKSAPQIGEGL